MQTIIFDMDGVLFDSEELDHKCWIKAAESMGLHDPEKLFFRCIGRPREDILEEISREYKEIEPGQFLEETLKLFDGYLAEHGMPLKPYAAECLAGLRMAGFKIGLGSSTPIDRVRDQLASTGLLGYFDDVVGGGMFVNGKPDPEIFLTACERLGGTPRETFVIEDSYNGIKAAHAAGMKPIMVPDLIEPTINIKWMCYRICSDLGEVLRYAVEGTL